MPVPQRQRARNAAPFKTLVILAALAALLTVLPSAHGCAHHGADTGCPAAEQPSAAHRAFQQQQRADILEMFATKAAARRAAAGNATDAPAAEAGSGSQRRLLRAADDSSRGRQAFLRWARASARSRRMIR